MKATDDLFLLIKSLTKNEKGYFKKYTSKHVVGDENKYISLFDRIDHSKQFNERELKKEIPHLPSDKNYLYKLIIRSLNEFHHGSSIDHELREILNAVEILFAKALYPQCEKLLNKAGQISEENEKFLFQLEIIDWKIQCKITQAQIEGLNIRLQKDKKQREAIIAKYNNLNDYRLIEYSLFYHTKTYGHPRTKTEAARYKKIMQDDLLKNSNKALGFWAKFHFYNAFNFYYDIIRDKNKLYTVRKQIIEFTESNPEMVRNNQIRYLIALNNLLNIQDELGKESEVEETLQKLRSIKSRSVDIQMRVFVYTYTIEFTKLIMKGDFDRCIQLRPEVDEGLKKFETKINREYLLALRYNLFYAYFGNGNYNEALKWINQILNDRYIELRKDVYAFVRIMQLVIHYELGNNDLLSYAILSAKRFFKKEERLFKFESIMLEFIEKAATLNIREKRNEAFLNLKSTLNELKANSHEAQVMEFFDFGAWIDSKVSGKTLKQIIHQK